MVDEIVVVIANRLIKRRGKRVSWGRFLGKLLMVMLYPWLSFLSVEFVKAQHRFVVASAPAPSGPTSEKKHSVKTNSYRVLLWKTRRCEERFLRRGNPGFDFIGS